MFRNYHYMGYNTYLKVIFNFCIKNLLIFQILTNLVCVIVPDLLKCNFGVFLESSEVLTVMPAFLLVMALYHCDVQLLLLWYVLRHITLDGVDNYCSAIWTIYLLLAHSHLTSNNKLSAEFTMVS
jgi:hypothetical protein